VLRYRNKSGFTLTHPTRPTPGGPSFSQLGMKQARSNSVFPVQACLLHSTTSDTVLAAINAALAEVPGVVMWYDETKKRGFIKRVTLREGFRSVEALKGVTAAAKGSRCPHSGAGHLGSGQGAGGSACTGQTGPVGGGSGGVSEHGHNGLQAGIDGAEAEEAFQGTALARVAGAPLAGRCDQSADSSVVLVNFMTAGLGMRKEQAALMSLVRALERVPSVIGVVQSVHTVHSTAAPAEHSVCLSGQDHIFIGIDTLAYRVSAHSYLQVNTLQCAELYRKIVDFGQLRSSDTVLDLYCGVGSIALWLAGCCAHVIGVEVIEAAVFDAQENARLNGVTNAQFVVGDLATRRARELLSARGANEADVVVVDPARAGLSAQVLDYLGTCKARAVVYVSCNSLSFCRDLKGLAGMGWQCTRIAAVDMFPQTDHLETVARLERMRV
jgi:tRNA/tmRNA/rRNA uracil-C5-methylase (TrmA/RlmC/RlmD family)